jgi:hypothetical protein
MGEIDQIDWDRPVGCHGVGLLHVFHPARQALGGQVRFAEGPVFGRPKLKHFHALPGCEADVSTGTILRVDAHLDLLPACVRNGLIRVFVGFASDLETDLTVLDFNLVVLL